MTAGQTVSSQPPRPSRARRWTSCSRRAWWTPNKDSLVRRVFYFLIEYPFDVFEQEGVDLASKCQDLCRRELAFFPFITGPFPTDPDLIRVGMMLQESKRQVEQLTSLMNRRSSRIWSTRPSGVSLIFWSNRTCSFKSTFEWPLFRQLFLNIFQYVSSSHSNVFPTYHSNGSTVSLVCEILKNRDYWKEETQLLSDW